MAPITEQAVDDLKSLIRQLEARVVELESRLSGGSGKSAPSEGIRMILMGPPGAGAFRLLFRTGGMSYQSGMLLTKRCR